VRCIETCVRMTQDFNEVSLFSQKIEQTFKVRVNVVSIQIKRFILTTKMVNVLIFFLIIHNAVYESLKKRNLR
jgi:hypothetical protein